MIDSTTPDSAHDCAPLSQRSGAACGGREQLADEHAVHARSRRPTGPENVDPAVLMAVTSIAARMMGLSLTAVEAVGLVVERMEIGQQRYGEPDVDGRDWARELEEEIVDRHAYDGLYLVAARRRRAHGQRQPLRVVRIPAPELDTSFDLSDASLDDEPTNPGLPRPTASFDVTDGEVNEVLR